MRITNKLKTTILLVLIILPTLAFAQKVEFKKPYKYTASNDDSRNSAKTKAMEEAQAALFQEIGVLVEARQKMTTTASGNSSKEDFVEELKTYTIGKVQTTVVAGTERFTDNAQGDMVYSATFSMVVDTADLYRYLDNIVKQKEQERLADIQKQQKIERLRKEIEELKKQVEIAKGKENEVFGPFLTAEKRFSDLKTQKDIAEEDYRRTVSAPNASTPAGMERTKNAMNFLTQTTNQYNAQEVEYKKLEKVMLAAQSDVSKAQDNLYNAQVLFANETGAPKPEKPAQTAAGNTKSQIPTQTQTTVKQTVVQPQNYFADREAAKKEKERQELLKKMEEIQKKRATEESKVQSAPPTAGLEQTIAQQETYYQNSCEGNVKNNRCADILFSLAAGYYKDARDGFIKAQNDYETAFTGWQKSGVGNRPVAPRPNYDKALQTFEKAVKLYPQSSKVPDGWFNNRKYLFARRKH